MPIDFQAPAPSLQQLPSNDKFMQMMMELNKGQSGQGGGGQQAMDLIMKAAPIIMAAL